MLNLCTYFKLNNNFFFLLNRPKRIQLIILMIILKYMEYLKTLIQKIILWFFRIHTVKIVWNVVKAT
jgi:hypothetical protein